MSEVAISSYSPAPPVCRVRGKNLGRRCELSAPDSHFVELMLPRNFSGPPMASARLARWFIFMSSSSQSYFSP